MDTKKLAELQHALIKEKVLTGQPAPKETEQILYNIPSKPATVPTADLASILSAYKVPGCQVKGTLTGPSVTTYLVALAPGTRLSSLTSAEGDLARDLGVTSVRVRDTMPGYPGCIGLEVPNEVRGTVLFKDTILAMSSKPKTRPYVAVGSSSTGQPVAIDLAAMPHLLVAGTTRSGKSQFLHAVICSLIRMHPRRDLQLVLVDPKRVEFRCYDNLPHLRAPVAREHGAALKVLDKLVDEMERRYEVLAEEGFSDIAQYKEGMVDVTQYGEGLMPYIVCVVDEFGDLMMSTDKNGVRDMEDSVIRLVQKGRAAGIHVVMATQNPTVAVISNQIKANMPMRVAFKVTSYTESKVILDGGGAERLLGEGDMLLSTGARLQGAYLDKRTIEDAVRAAGG